MLLHWPFIRQVFQLPCVSGGHTVHGWVPNAAVEAVFRRLDHMQADIPQQEEKSRKCIIT